MTYLMFWFFLVRPAPIVHPLPHPVEPPRSHITQLKGILR